MRKVVASLVAAAFLLLTPMTALADYTSSVAYKDAPTIDESSVVVSDSVIQEKLEDNTYQVAVTPVSKADDTEYSEISDVLNNAFQQIKDTQVADLFPDLEDGLKEVLGSDTTDEEIKDLLDKMVVTNIFDISIVDPAQTEVVDLPDSTQFTVALDLGLTQDDVFLLYHEEETGKWVLVPYKWLENGMVQITLNGLSPLAVLMPAEQGETIVPSGDKNPETKPDTKPDTNQDTTTDTTPGLNIPASEGSSGTTSTLPNSTTGSTGSTTGSNVSTGVSSASGTLFVIGAVVAAAGIFFVVKAKKRID